MVIEKPRCKRCDSSQVYTRQSTSERVCKQCGHVEKIQLEGGEDYGKSIKEN